MENTFYMSIGYPVGLGEKEENQFFYNVELSGNLIGLSYTCYNIWKYCFFDIKSYPNILDYFNESKISKKQIDDELETLVHNKVLVKLNVSNFDEFYKKLKILTPMKNGFGIGVNIKENNAKIINQKQDFTITTNQYNLWSMCDNRTMIVDIVSKYSMIYNIDEKLVIKTILNDLLYLKTVDLLRFNKREKRRIYE